jgi:hypothetical protein
MNGTPPPTRVRESAPLSPDRRGAPSSVLAGMAYDQHQAILRLEFRDGAVYQYLQVPHQTYRDLLQADSQGALFKPPRAPRFSVRSPASRGRTPGLAPSLPSR